MFVFARGMYSLPLNGREESATVERLAMMSFPTGRELVGFVAYLGPLQDVLHLICCPVHLRHWVIDDLEARGITFANGISTERMIPGEDKAFVIVSGGICPISEKEINDINLR